MFSKQDLLQLETTVTSLVKDAGKYVLDHWNKITAVQLKNERDIVTNVDIEVENNLRSSLTRLLPEAGFLVEEGKSLEKEELNWTIDPIDGTKNYGTLYPAFYTQVSLLYKQKPVLGVIYNPVSDQLFSASKGNGTKLNGTGIKVKNSSKLESAIVDLDFGGTDAILDWKLTFFNKLARNVYRVRISGGFGNLYLLTGAFDLVAYLDQQNPLKFLVDNAPRIVLFEEAGFEAYTFADTKKNVYVWAGNELMVQFKALELFEKVY